MDDLAPISDNSPVWPRRASRACASCRRDKVRCDGARPCSGCTKKGFSADQCVDGCDPCRRARVRCENGKPCQRCRDMQLECLEETVVSTQPDSPTQASAKMMRANATERAKLACTNCRKDNKKCDDQRPCSRCVVRNEECVHVGRGPKLVKLRCEACRKDGKRCEDVRPCSNCVETGQSCATQPRKGRGHGTRVKAACVSCRRDKIRCDGVRPCASCLRKGTECIERACKDCSREGRAAECTHRKAAAMAEELAADEVRGSGTMDHNRTSSSDKDYPSQALQDHLHLPPISHPYSTTSSHSMYAPTGHMAHTQPPVTHYYYQQQGMIGPGQPPPPVVRQPYMQPTTSEQNIPYYPAIDPNIDNDSSARPSTGTYPSNSGHGDQNAGPPVSTSANR